MSNNGYTDFLCTDTGIKLKVKKIPFSLTDELFRKYERDHPQPKPPTQEVDYGDGEKIKEPNASHPAYLKRMADYNDAKNLWINAETKRIYTELAIECEVDKEAVRKVRDEMKKHGVELAESDKHIYIWQIATGTFEGYLELTRAIQHRSQPTQEAVDNALARFPDKVAT